MPKKPLIETNPYLRSPTQRKALLYTSVTSNTAVEGAHVAIPQPLRDQSPKPTGTTLREREESYGSRR